MHYFRLHGGASSKLRSWIYVARYGIESSLDESSPTQHDVSDIIMAKPLKYHYLEFHFFNHLTRHFSGRMKYQ